MHATNESPIGQPPTLRLVGEEESPPYDGQAKREPFVMLPIELIRNPSIPDRAFRVYALLVHHHGERGCFPLRETLAAGLGVHISKIDRALRDLEQAKLITRKRRGQGKANEYELAILPTKHNDLAELQSLELANMQSLELANLLGRTRTSELERKSAPLPPAAGDDGFDPFWTDYPKKVAKEDARRAWRRLRPDHALQAVMRSALARQRSSPDWTKDGGKYIPYPATWLNGKRWNDELPTGANGAAPADDRWLGLDPRAPIYFGSEGQKRLKADLAERRAGLGVV